MRRLIVVSALALSACGGGEKNPNRPTAAPDVAANFSQPIDARAADGAWGLTIRGQQLTLKQTNQPDLVAMAPGARIQPHEASWTAALPDGRTMTVNVYASACSEPASGTSYPFAVEVLLPGATTLAGCGGRPAAAAKG